ncbi:S9 family peptidase [Aliikangiella marina]|uniref:S9 family peptidase n=1 Tax=Aliikangiella marina TaxID=1712262 RepID=A0A545T9P6_9GAMM|nr:S9 family peptidase [Aliikangiella marina]TQV73932.1 S9 family peptidase [Aliikangiella marina]
MKNNKLISLLLLGLVLSPLSVVAKQTVMTLQQTVETKQVVASIPSPSGEHIAYTLRVPREAYEDKDGTAYVELHVVDKAGNSRRFVTGKVNVASISWGDNGQSIYFLAKRNDDKHRSVYRIAIDGGEAEKLVSTSADISAYTLNADSSKLTYLAKPAKDPMDKTLKEKGFKAKVYEESIKKASAFTVDLKDLEKAHKKIDIKEHIRSVEYHPTNDQLLMRVTPTALIDDNYVASQYRIYNQKGKQLKAFDTEGKLGAARWSPDGKYVAIIGAEDKHDPSSGRLFIANSKSGKIIEPVKDYMGHVRDIRWVSDYQVAYLGHVGTQSEVSLVNVDSGKVSNKIPAGEYVIESIQTDRSGKMLAGIASSDKHPREVFDLNGQEPKRLTDSNPWLADIKMPKQETVIHKARDGVELRGVLAYPINYKKGKRYPLIMMVHGGPEAHVSDSWLDRYSYPIKYATGNGYAVFLPNYRGSTGMGVEYSKLGQADYAGAEFNDLVDAIEHLSDMGIVDKKRVGITGGSYGGYASAWAATALSEHFAASVMFVGISNQLSKFGTTDIPVEMYNVHARNYPWDKWQWMLERSPIYHTDKAKTPILIMHGEEDTRVHPAQSMELYRYIKTRTDTPVRMVTYPGEPHGNRKSAAQLDYSMRLMRWMDFYLKGKKKGKAMPAYELDHKAVLKKMKEEKKDK